MDDDKYKHPDVESDLLKRISRRVFHLMPPPKSKTPNCHFPCFEDDFFEPASQENILKVYNHAKKYFYVEDSSSVLSLIYLEKLIFNGSKWSFYVNSTNWYSTIVMCIYLAVKYMDDLTVTVSSAVGVFHIPSQRLCEMEIVTFKILEFNLYIDPDRYHEYVRHQLQIRTAYAHEIPIRKNKSGEKDIFFDKDKIEKNGSSDSNCSEKTLKSNILEKVSKVLSVFTAISRSYSNGKIYIEGDTVTANTVTIGNYSDDINMNDI